MASEERRKEVVMAWWDNLIGPAIGAAAGGLASVATGGQSGGGSNTGGSSQNSGSSSGSNISGSSSSSKSHTGPAKYMKPYLQGEGGIFPEAKDRYFENLDQGYFGQTPEQQGMNAATAAMLQQYLTNPGAVQQMMDEAGSFGDRYSNTLQGTDPNVQGSMNQFLSGQADTRGLDAMQQAATNRAMVGYGDAVQDAGDMFTNQIAPSIRSGAMLSGQYGGSRQGVAEGVSSGMLNKQLARNARDLGLGSMDIGTELYGDAAARANQNQYGMSQFGANYGLNRDTQGMQNTLQNAGIEQAGGDQIDSALNRYLAGQQGGYNAFGRNVSDAQAEQDFGWQQLMNYMAAVQGQGIETNSSSSSSSFSQGNNSSSNQGSSRNFGSSSPQRGFNLLEGISAGGHIGQGIGEIDFRRPGSGVRRGQWWVD